MSDSLVAIATSTQDLQRAHVTRHNVAAERWAMGGIASVIVTMCACIALVADGHPVLCGIAAGVGIVATVVMGAAASQASRRRDQIVYPAGSTP